jgi:REP element-mobilizing transposase RayT
LTVAFERICIRTLPDGSVRKVYPYHVSLEGMAQLVLCRDDEDYDVMVKYIFICARRKNVIVVIYIAMSNHGHATILAASQEDADDFTVEWLRMYSQYFSKKYRRRKVLRHTSAVAIYLDSDWYVRNALAYVPKNALDAQSRVEDYRWSGYRGMFCHGKAPGGFRKAATLKRREKEACFHTHDSLEGLPWIINADGELEPASVCDHAYLEAAFGYDQAFFLKTIGMVSMAEMQQKLVDNPRQRQNDTEMLKTIESISQGWFKCSLLDLPLEKKARLLPYVYRAYRTSVAQLARCFGMAPDEVARKVGKHPSK